MSRIVVALIMRPCIVERVNPSKKERAVCTERGEIAGGRC